MMIFGTNKRPVEDQGRDMNYLLKKLERVVFASPNYPLEKPIEKKKSGGKLRKRNTGFSKG